ncbi:hypothetical protein P6709_00845 [Jeotgalibacillus sp. ET6]|uniref:hypothetical protein n=1 Tax=Jeotgalibacillus sp. ET6 TaxID=3037260 RepID=UPI00241868B6|nr:hypothetical protein [Jeotgalibacillus sp. ET6]MDG5470272.1 hypothetical protein [Jeotgalibacillus sp. ET6]
MEHNKAGAKSEYNLSRMYSQKPQTLKHGQLVLGLVEKKVSEQKAIMKIGSQHVTVNVSKEMREGSKGLYQVSVNEDEIELKPISEKAGADKINRTDQTMRPPRLDFLKENRGVSAEFLKDPLPLSREQQAKATDWTAASINKEQARSIINLMFLKKQPFTDAVFHSYQRGMQGTEQNLQADLSRLVESLSSEKSAAASQVIHTLKKIQNPSQYFISQQMTAKLFGLLTDPSTASHVRETALHTLKQLEVLPWSVNLSDWSEGLREAYMSGREVQKDSKGLFLSLTEEAVQRSALLKSEGRVSERAEELVSFVKNSSDETVKTLSKQLFERMIEIQAMHESSQKNPFAGKTFIFEELHLTPKDRLLNPALLHSNRQSPAVKEVHDLILSVSSEAEKAFNSLPSGRQLTEMFRGIFSVLGIDYESRLTGSPQSIEQISEGLKPQLTMLLKDPNLSLSAKETVQLLINKFNGQQLLSSESGNTSHIFFQLPVYMKEKLLDLTMQWTGKKQKNGKLDADHSRILFYINLENLKETVIDMTVQKRIISIDVYTHKEGLQKLGESLKPFLKSQLEKADYQLSHIKFLSSKQASPPPLDPAAAQMNTFSSGVDIRI